MTRVHALTTVALLPALLAAAAADAQPLDRDAVLRLAAERAPALQAAVAAVDAAAGDLRAARAWRFNPELELEAGPRRSPGGDSTDRSIGLSQRLDLAGRGPRIEAAAAERDAIAGNARSARVSVLAQAARLHLEALHAAGQRRLAAEGVALHERLLDIARVRLEAGESGSMDVHQATVGAARARMRLAAATAAEQDVLAELASLLALAAGADLQATGDLTWPLPLDVDTVLAAAAQHPDLDALAAEARAGAARTRLAGAARWPEVGVSASVGQEEDADIVRIGLSLGLPVFARGQGEREAASAAERIAGIRLAAARRDRQDRAARAWNRHRDLQAALAAADSAATGALEASSRIAEQSYRLGDIALDRVLVVERENLDARHDLNDLRLAVALAALQVTETAALPPLAEAKEETR